MGMVKICNMCKLEKSWDEFTIESRTKKPISRCKKCMAIATKQYISSNKGKSLLDNRISNNKDRDYSIIVPLICSICNKEKLSSEFDRNINTPNGYSYYCKVCHRQKKSSERAIKNAKLIQEKQKAINSTKIFDPSDTKTCRCCNEIKSIIEFGKDLLSKDGKNKYCLICTRLKAQTADAKKKRNIYLHNKLQTSPKAKLMKIVRTRLLNALKSKNADKHGSAVALLCCTIDFLKEYIEAQFLDDMSWNNFGKVWQIDHILPYDMFDIEDPKELAKVCHYTNLQPLYNHINAAKGSCIVDEDWYIQKGVIRRRMNLPIY